MIEFKIDIESIIKTLNSIPKEKRYETERILIATGKYKLKKKRSKWLGILKSK